MSGVQKAKVTLRLLLPHYKDLAQRYREGAIGLSPAEAYETCAQDLAWILKLLEEEGDQA